VLFRSVAKHPHASCTGVVPALVEQPHAIQRDDGCSDCYEEADINHGIPQLHMAHLAGQNTIASTANPKSMHPIPKPNTMNASVKSVILNHPHPIARHDAADDSEKGTEKGDHDFTCFGVKYESFNQ